MNNPRGAKTFHPGQYLSLLIGLVILFAASSANGFAIKLGNYNHQAITLKGLNPHSGLNPSAVVYPASPKLEVPLDNGAQVSFSIAVVDEITEYNIRVDDLQGLAHSDKHFDSDDLARGSRRLIQLREVIVDDLVDAAFIDFLNPSAVLESETRVRHARSMMGQALHTLQDFYAHSNWVELKNFSTTNINTDLGVKPLVSPGLNQSCDETNPANGGVLTSGWFEGTGLQICNAPQGKCAHGDGVACGINKDSLVQAGGAYVAARAQATVATRLFAKDTLLQVLAAYTRLTPGLSQAEARQSAQLAVCQFMGVPNPLSTCVTTHSLTVQKLNSATLQPTLEGLVQSTSGNLTPAIDCGLLCEGTAVAGTSVVLAAKKSGSWIFSRWAEGGVCAGSTSPECSFTLTGNLLARPEFAFFNGVIALSPKASFIRSDPGDPTLSPIVINLSALGITPGQEIELSSSGYFSWGLGGADEGRNTIMVFSSSDELLPYTEQFRVTGAIPTSKPAVVTTDTCFSPATLPTDIAEDFAVNGPQVVTVPAGALFLFAGTWDCAYADNSDPNGDLVITIKQ